MGQNKQPKLYKVISYYNQSKNGGRFDWTPYLPKKKNGKWIPGKWVPKIWNILLCTRGYHVTNRPNTWGFGRNNWNGNKCFIVECKLSKKKVTQNLRWQHKVVVSTLRLLRPVHYLKNGKLSR